MRTVRPLARGSDSAGCCTTCQVMLWTLYHSNFCQIVRDRFSVISYIVAGHWLPVRHRGWALLPVEPRRGRPAGMSLRASLYSLTNRDTDFIKDEADKKRCQCHLPQQPQPQPQPQQQPAIFDAFQKQSLMTFPFCYVRVSSNRYGRSHTTHPAHYSLF